MCWAYLKALFFRERLSERRRRIVARMWLHDNDWSFAPQFNLLNARFRAMNGD